VLSINADGFGIIVHFPSDPLPTGSMGGLVPVPVQAHSLHTDLSVGQLSTMLPSHDSPASILLFPQFTPHVATSPEFVPVPPLLHANLP